MCGIAGIFAKQMTAEHQRIIENILQDQFARGPNHQASITIPSSHSQLILGHNRLSIIDLSTDSNQPMWDATKRYCITFNGEIYNYLELRKILKENNFHFNTNGDTEIILNAFAHWGIDALSYFQGPFAFALFDTLENKLWLCRDRFGVRPLYYVIEQNNLYFSSTTRVLAKTLQLKPNLNYVSKGLNFLVYEDGSDISPYENLIALPAGCYNCVELDKNGVLSSHTTSYYDLAVNVKNLAEELPLHNMDYVLQLIQDRLNQAIHLRLRTDVPLGIALSSGLDSSAIASLVREQHQKVMGFSYGNPSDKKTEGPLVQKCAEFLGMDIHYISPSVEEMIAALFKTIEAQDAPFSSLSIVAQFLLYQHIQSKNVKVILGGQGGDESFMGYRKFMLFQLRHFIKNKNYFSAMKNMMQMLPMLTAETKSFGAYWKHRHRYFGRADVGTVLQLPYSQVQLSSPTHLSLQARQIQDITQFSLPTLLRYEDRNAMGNSVESRLPFLDHRLVELGCALPDAFKLRAGFGKWPIRQIMQNKIPDQIRLAYYKRGFDISLPQLLNAGLGHAIRSSLKCNQAVIKEFLRKELTIDQAFSNHQLINRRRAIAEAVSLLWLSKAYA